MHHVELLRQMQSLPPTLVSIKFVILPGVSQSLVDVLPIGTKKGGGNLHLIDQYFTENKHGHSGLGSRERRDLCLISDACAQGGGGNIASPPAGGGSTRVAPILYAKAQTGSIEVKNLALLHEDTGSGNYNLMPRTAGANFFSYFWTYRTGSANGTCPDVKTLTQQDLTSSCSDQNYNNEYDCEGAGSCSNTDPGVNAAQHTSESACINAGVCSDAAHSSEYDCLQPGTCTDPSHTDKYGCESQGTCSNPSYNNDSYSCTYFGHTFIASNTWTYDNTWTLSGNSWTSDNNVWTAINELGGKDDLVLSAATTNYYTFDYQFSEYSGPMVQTDTGPEGILSFNGTGEPTRGVPGANFLLKDYSFKPYADFVYQSSYISIDFLNTALCSSYQYQTECDAYQQCSMGHI